MPCIGARVMSVQTREFVDVAAKARKLGCRVPAGIALLPANFATASDIGEFVFNPATPYIRSAWKSVRLEDEGPRARDMTQSSSIGIVSQAYANTESAEVPLVAFFGPGLLTGPEWSLAVALGLVSRVLALHPVCASPWEVRFHAVVGRPSGGCVCIEYQGDAFGIVALTRDVRRIWAGK